MTEPRVLSETDARGVTRITLNRPEVNNAYDGALIDALADAVSRAGDDASVRVLVLRGAGRHFQAGADLRWIREVAGHDAEENRQVSRRTAEALATLDRLDKPTVAAVHGGCFGGGVGIVASCDVVVAATDAVFGITETRWGLTPDIIVPQLVAVLGERNTRRYALGCERFDAVRARGMGLVDEVCAPGELDATVQGLVDQFLLAAPGAMAATKRAILAARTPTSLAALVASHGAQRRSAEAAEGLASFADKRLPAWYPESR